MIYANYPKAGTYLDLGVRSRSLDKKLEMLMDEYPTTVECGRRIAKHVSVAMDECSCQNPAIA